MSELILLRPVGGPPGTRLGALLGDGLEPVAPLRPVTGCFPRVVGEVLGPEEMLKAAAAGLGDGAASAEALAVRLRGQDVELGWAEPESVPSRRVLLSLCRARGGSSVELVRAHPSLLTGLQLGAWFDAPWRTRLIRRLARGPLRLAARVLALRSRRWLLAACDLEFWAGARSQATHREWRRLTAGSYVALVYHRFAGELKPGQERIDISPRRFRRQLRALRLIGFRPLPADHLASFHSGSPEPLSGRSVVLTVDDAMADCVEPLIAHTEWAPYLFAPTRGIGHRADWLDGEPVAGWSEIRDLAAAGIAVGSHARTHRRLTGLSPAEREEELAGSLEDLRRQLERPLEMVAFPNGDHDDATCRAARAAGYRAAFTTEKGRNGLGTDPFCLKRVSVHGHDGAPAVLWKALTGEGLPASWLALRAIRARLSLRS